MHVILCEIRLRRGFGSSSGRIPGSVVTQSAQKIKKHSRLWLSLGGCGLESVIACARLDADLLGLCAGYFHFQLMKFPIQLLR